MFRSITGAATATAIALMSVWPAPAQTPPFPPASSTDWQSYGEAVRDWSEQISQFRWAFQRRPVPPVPPVPPAMLAMGINRSFLGVHVVEMDAARAAELKLKDEMGVEITGIEADSPAERAGLKRGDVVIEYQGQRVEGTEQFIRLVRETPAGRQVKLLVHRQGAAAQAVTATVAARKPKIVAESGPRVEFWMPDLPRAYVGMRSPRFGVEAEGLEGQLAEYFGVKEGVLVRSVAKGSAAEKSGFKAGDVITKVDQKPLDSPRDLSEALRSSRDKKSVAVTVVREKREMTLTASVEEDRAERQAPARTVIRREEFRF